MWLRKKTQIPPTDCISCRLNPHNQLGRLCVYGIHKKSLRAATKENSLTSSDSCGPWRQEHTGVGPDWNLSCPTSPEISTVLEGILGRWGGLWLPATERTLTAVTQEKHLLFLCFDLFCRIFRNFVFIPLCCSCWFYWHYEIQLSFFFFFQSHFLIVINLCLCIGLLQFCGVFLNFFFLFFLILIF